MYNPRKRNFISVLFSRQIVFTVIGLGVLVFISIPLARNISKQYKINNEIKELNEEIAAFEDKNLELKKTLEYLESDQFAQEQARINLNYKKEGEEVVVIKNIEEEEKEAQNSVAVVVGNYNNKNSSNPDRWWEYFFLR